MVGPQALVGDQVANHGVVRPVLQDRITEPGREPPPAELHERSVLGAHQGAGEPFGQVVGGPPIAEQLVQPALESPLGRPGLELADLLERGDRSGEGQRQSPQDGQLGGRGAECRTFLGPPALEDGVDLGDDRPQLGLPGFLFRLAWRSRGR